MKKGSFSLTSSIWRLYGFCFLYFSLVTGTQAKCPVQLSQKSVVVEYGGSVAVNCTASVPHDGMGWEASEGGVDKTRDSVVTWTVSDLREWDIKPFCYINYNKTHDTQCEEELPVTVYKTPDSVSISIVNHTGPMIEGEQYELQCDVQDVAPVQNLTVKWYKGQTLLSQTTFTDTSRKPVNEVAKLLITANRADDGAQFWCEAELDLGAEGPQPPPKKTSEPLNITVHFKPIINETKLPSTVTVFRGYSVVLVCEAEGNPKPKISWSLSENVDGDKLTVSESTPENVHCNASNSVDTTTRQVKVYKPDISISFVNHTGPVIADENYELQCLIKNGAPTKSITVRWYKQNKTIFTDTIKTPVKNIRKLKIQPNRSDDGAQYWCEAELEAEGPQRYQTMSSEHLNI
ncbi:hemicentin-1-like, partial [Labeo rohita]|uniref:hemicentin-1-like n=1 Tax=Labeo rohita TaxID=84645 RepID=UPI0021E2A0CF